MERGNAIVSDAESFRRSAVTFALCVINIIVFLLEELNGESGATEVAIRFGAMYRPLMLGGEWWRMVTSMFVHFGLDHIISNTISLLLIGISLEQHCGHIRFLVIYLFGGLAGNVLSFLVEGTRRVQAVSAGASGAVFSLLGAYLALALIWKKTRTANVNLVLTVAAVGYMFYRSMGTGVNVEAHLGGLIAGFLLGLVLCRPGKSSTVFER
uniref:rhomboid family intramembrane serine protease n=1 Tax=Eubacterium cellulosolvens TaxID=29322 RepID=UPI000683DC42|nr:rhomboid family intramembrane serine protease [[Eubacterium] cellulosolvens]